MEGGAGDDPEAGRDRRDARDVGEAAASGVFAIRKPPAEGCLSTLEAVARALDELQRLALVDPLTRVHNQVKGLSTAQRRKVLLSLVQTHGADLLNAQRPDGRLEVLHVLVRELPERERLALMRSVLSHEGFVGSIYELLVALAASLDTHDAVALLKSLLSHARPMLSPPEVLALRD